MSDKLHYTTTLMWNLDKSVVDVSVWAGCLEEAQEKSVNILSEHCDKEDLTVVKSVVSDA